MVMHEKLNWELETRITKLTHRQLIKFLSKYDFLDFLYIVIRSYKFNKLHIHKLLTTDLD